MILVGVGTVSSECRSRIDRYVGQHMGRHRVGRCSDRVSVDVSVDLSTDTISANVETDTVGRVSADTRPTVSVEYRSTGAFLYMIPVLFIHTPKTICSNEACHACVLVIAPMIWLDYGEFLNVKLLKQFCFAIQRHVVSIRLPLNCKEAVRSIDGHQKHTSKIASDNDLCRL